MKTTTTTLLTLALVALAATAIAQPGPRGGGDGPRFDRLCERLDLSDDQKAAIGKIREESRAEGLKTRKEILRLRNELEGLMLQDDPDAGDAEKLIRKIGDLKADQKVRRMETRLAVRAQLTDEQRDEMIAMQGKKKPGRGGKGRGHGGPGARGGACRTMQGR